MKIIIRIKLIVLFLCIIRINISQGQNHSVFEMNYPKTESIKINESFSKSTTISPFEQIYPIFSFAVDATYQLNGYKSLVRIILVTNDGEELLVLESNYIMCGDEKISVSEFGEETSRLNGVIPGYIKIQIEDASVVLSSASWNSDMQNKSKYEDFVFCSESRKKKQDSIKIERITKQIQQNGYQWKAGETPISRMTYQQKTKMFGNPMPNLRGYDYYANGIFDLWEPNKTKSAQIHSETSEMVKSFSWKNRHGKDWITDIRNQLQCGSCAIFAATAVTEAFVNLYYNQLLNLNLSEQNAVSCVNSTNPGTCSITTTWNVRQVLDYYHTTGVGLESCEPYNPNYIKPCDQICLSSGERIKIGGYYTIREFSYPYTEEGYKKMIIQYGPLVSGLITDPNYSGHKMALVGFDYDNSDGKTVWIFKNSYGDTDNNGYQYIKTPVSNLYGGDAVIGPVISLNYTESNRICSDNDHDGYYWWGLGPKPIIPNICIPDTPDGDDSNPNLGPMDENGNCLLISSPYVFPEHLITSSETWDRTYYECGNVIVKNGGSLDLNATTVYLGSNTTFSVELGGTLTFNSGTITHGSGTMEAVVPTLTETTTVTGIGCTGAKPGGNVTSDGGGTITARGVCYGTASNPTIADNKTVDPGTTGSWISGSMTIVPGTLYYVRSYATNEAGTGYGIQTTYTQIINVPTLATTTAANSITCSSASSGGHVTSDGCGTVTARGICWATTQNPTTANSTSASGAGTGFFTGNLTGLTAGTTYYVRSYAINSVGTAYGEQISFTTPAPVIPVLAATASASSITSNSTTSGGNVTSDGCGTLSETGLCWATTSNPTTANSKVTSSPATGTFTATITGLSASTTYYVRSYAVNSVGTAYGTEISFTTLAPPVVVPTLASTTTVTSIGQTTATSGGECNL